jgi:hypothetical protein
VARSAQTHLPNKSYSLCCAAQYYWGAIANMQIRINWKIRHEHLTSCRCPSSIRWLRTMCAASKAGWSGGREQSCTKTCDKTDDDKFRRWSRPLIWVGRSGQASTRRPRSCKANDVLIHIAPRRRLIAFAHPLFGRLARSVILFISAPRIAIHGYCLSLNLAAESGEQNTR